MAAMTALAGTVAHEARMAQRARVLWLAMVPAVLLSALLGLGSPVVGGLADPVARVGAWAMLLTTFCAPALAVALADRFSRLLHSRRPGLAELLDSTPGSRTLRMIGTLAGPLAAGLAPVAVVLAAVCAATAVIRGEAGPVLGAGLVALGTIVVPGAVFATALAALLALLVPVAAARVAVVALWFWSTHLNSELLAVPTLARTLFSPLGGYPAAAWLHASPAWASGSTPGVLSPPPMSPAALLSVALVLSSAAVFVAIARGIAGLRA
jgi:ABC-2 type transport system permease protein